MSVTEPEPLTADEGPGADGPVALDPSSVWPRLKAGALRCAGHGTTPMSVFLDVGEPPMPRPSPSVTNVERLERFLVGAMQKELAIDEGIAISSVNRMLSKALAEIGLKLALHAVPAALVTLVQLSIGQTQRSCEVSRVRQAGLTIHRIAFARPEMDLACLTPAERDVTALLIDGLGGREIAQRRARAKRTVSNQLAHVYVKVGAARRVPLIARLGLLAPGHRPLVSSFALVRQ